MISRNVRPLSGEVQPNAAERLPTPLLYCITAVIKRTAVEPIEHIEVYPAVKADSMTNLRPNCIGAFEAPDHRKIPERDILLETRKGVALSYAPTQIAI